MDTSRRLVTFYMACAMAKAIIKKDLGIDDAEWVARVKETAIKQGYALPEFSEFWTKVIRAVDRTIDRPAPLDPRSYREPDPIVRPLSRDDSAKAFADIQRRWHAQQARMTGLD